MSPNRGHAARASAGSSSITLLLNLAGERGKIAVGMLSGSLAMVADGYHSLVDGANNVIGLIVAAFAYAPPDRGHPYGHRKFETAATPRHRRRPSGPGLQGRGPGLRPRRRGRRLPAIGWLNWAVMIATMAMNLFVSWYEAREGRRLGSEYLRRRRDPHPLRPLRLARASSPASPAAKAGLLGRRRGGRRIGAVIAFQAVQILLRLLPRAHRPRRARPAERSRRRCGGCPGCGRCARCAPGAAHDAVYVDLVAHVDGALSLRAAHEVADRIEAAVKKAHPRDRGRGRAPRARRSAPA